jgi:hypothetical protein
MYHVHADGFFFALGCKTYDCGFLKRFLLASSKKLKRRIKLWLDMEFQVELTEKKFQSLNPPFYLRNSFNFKLWFTQILELSHLSHSRPSLRFETPDYKTGVGNQL